MALVRVGRAWDAAASLSEQRLLGEHLAYLARLAESGEVIQAGTFLGHDDRPGPAGLVGLVVYGVAVERARELAGADPAVAAGLVECEALPWYVAIQSVSSR